MLRQAGERERERAELTALAASHPQHARVHRQLVDALVAGGDREAQLGELRRWTTSLPDDVAGWRELAQALLAASEPAALAEALAAAEHADYLAKGQDAAALELRAEALQRSGSAAEAERLRRRAAGLLTR